MPTPGQELVLPDSVFLQSYHTFLSTYWRFHNRGEAGNSEHEETHSQPTLQEHIEAAKLELAAITARSMEDTGVCHAAGMDRQHSIPLTVDFDPESTSCESGALLEAQGELAGSSHALPVEASGTQEGEQQPAPCSPHPTHQQAAVQHPSHHSQGASYAPELLWWMLPPPPPPPPPPPAFLFFTPQPQGSWDQPAYS